MRVWLGRRGPFRFEFSTRSKCRTAKCPSACLPCSRKLEPRGRALGSYSERPNWIRTRTRPDRVFTILCLQTDLGSTRLRKRKRKRPAGNIKKSRPLFSTKPVITNETNERSRPALPLAREMCIRTTRGGTLSRPKLPGRMTEGAAEKEKDHGPHGLGAAAEGGAENFVMVAKIRW